MRGIEPVVDKEERGIAVGKHSGKKFTKKERKLLTRKQLFLGGPYYLSFLRMRIKVGKFNYPTVDRQEFSITIRMGR